MPRRTPKRIVDFFKNSDDSEELSMGPTNNSPQQEQEVLSLLRKISTQLDGMGVSNDLPESQSVGQSPVQQTNQSAGSAGSGIQALYNLLQQSMNKQENTHAANQTESISGSGVQGMQQNMNKQNIMNQGKNTKETKDVAQQILEQAQYELANELEASLQKLKEVITESEKLAAKISALIGQDSN